MSNMRHALDKGIAAMTTPLRRAAVTYCNDAGKPGCLTIADPAWVMRFDDIGEPPIHWCSVCGPEAHAMEAALMEAMETRPGFQAKFAEALAGARRRDD